MERSEASGKTEPSPIRPDTEREEAFEILVEAPPHGLIRRFFTIQRHILGMLFGALVGRVRTMKESGQGRGLGFFLQRVIARFARVFLDKKLIEKPFPVQFRRRLETLGPTFIKLGQILSLREDLLPEDITTELKNLLDRLPVVRFERYKELLAQHLGRPIETMFSSLDPHPLGSASIAQIHRATTIDGHSVVIKMVKPGIREQVRRDVILLRLFGAFLQIFLSRFQPRRIINEFCHYTIREVDLRLEADNAETFAANFKDQRDIVFPEIYRKYSSQDVLTMEFLQGIKPSSEEAQALPESDKDRIVNRGAEAIIRMLYRDGFFHADLHPGNLLILRDRRVGFIDLGMVGRFDDELRRTLLYYFYCLVLRDVENASKYLLSVADAAPGADTNGFRREIEEVSRRWALSHGFSEFSLGQLMLYSVGQAGRFKVYFPVEMVLMVKALVTYEGVGQILKPDLDIVSLSQAHASRIFMQQFSPLRIAKESLRGAPEMVDALVKAPLLVTEGLRFLEKTTRKQPENPLAGLRGTLFAGACLVAGAILVAFGGPWPLWAGLFLLAFVLAMRRGK